MSRTKKQAILGTALDLFVENGIDGTSIREIAEGANTVEGNIYRHFKSKKDLARQLFLDCANEFRSTFEDAIAQLDDPEKQVEAIVRAIFDFSIQREREFAYILVVNHRKEIINVNILSKPLPKDLFTNILEAGIESGVFRPMDSTMAVAWIVGMVQRSFTFIQQGITTLPHDDVVEQTVEAALQMIKA